MVFTGIIGNIHIDSTSDTQCHICQSMVVKDQEHVTVVDWLMDMICIPENMCPRGGAGWGVQ